MRDLLSELAKANKEGGVVLFARAVPEGVLCAILQADGSELERHIIANQNDLNEFNVTLAELTAGRRVFIENKMRYAQAFSYINCNDDELPGANSAVEVNLFSTEETIFSQNADYLLRAFANHIRALSGVARKSNDTVH